MNKSLKNKLILSYLVIAITTVLVVSVVVRLNSGQSLMNLVVEQQTAQMEEAVITYYTTNGTLDGFFDYYLQVSRPEPQPEQSDLQAAPQSDVQAEQPEPLDDHGPKIHDIRGVLGLVDADYKALIPTFKFEIGQTVPADMLQQAVAIKNDEQIIAWIIPDTKFQFQLNSEEELFLQRTNLAIGLAALAGVIAAVGMGIFLAGGLLKPIRRLTEASQKLARGNLEQQVPVTSQDELGQLTSTFNQMSTDLARADQQRKRLTADITHDLSTPLQIISGYMEMMEEGMVTMTPQRIEIIKTEVDHLRRLVSDLTTLTQVEAGGLDIQKEPVKPVELLDRIYQTYQPIAARQGVDLEMDAPEGIPEIQVDEGRMQQVLKNLVENALRYTPKGGSIHLAAVHNGSVQLKVMDSGSGIDADDLPFVFDRFYQADKARGANVGKMGLGLAICKALVTAQGGRIAAESAGRGQGATMIITF
jgi:signal transduction histidine kinase